MAQLLDTTIDGNLHVSGEIQIGEIRLFPPQVCKGIGQKTTTVAAGNNTIDSYEILEDGLYYFVTSITATSKSDSKYLTLYMKKGEQWTPIEMTDTGTHTRLSASCILECSAGDICEVFVSHNDTQSLSVNSRFGVTRLR